MSRQIADGIVYIGADDLELDLFEGQYILPEGMAYNSYLIISDKVAIMDTADAAVAPRWEALLEEALAGRTPDYLVAHHMEPDHAALIAKTLEKYPACTLVTSAAALKMLGQFFPGIDHKVMVIKEGDTLELGPGKTLRFFAAPLVHWPEVMVSLLEQDGVLFSADAFGKFGALSKCGFWGDEDGDWACEARRYYFNICGKYGVQVQKLLGKLSGLDIRIIAPLHGPVLRENLAYYLDLYNTWSSYGVETPGVFVAYASMHGGTREAALKEVELLKAHGCPKVAVADLSRDDMAEAVEDAFRYGKLIVAAPSYDGGLFTPVYNFIHLLQAKGWTKRRVGLIENGSWAPASARIMKEMFASMKDVDVVEPAVTIKSVMKQSDIPALELLASTI